MLPSGLSALEPVRAFPSERHPPDFCSVRKFYPVGTVCSEEPGFPRGFFHERPTNVPNGMLHEEITVRPIVITGCFVNGFLSQNALLKAQGEHD